MSNNEPTVQEIIDTLANKPLSRVEAVRGEKGRNLPTLEKGVVAKKKKKKKVKKSKIRFKAETLKRALKENAARRKTLPSVQ